VVSKRGVLRVFRFYARPNMQCTVGALVGIVAIVLPWAYNVNHYARILIPYPAGQVFRMWIPPYQNLLDLIAWSGDYAFYGMLFALGTLLALYSPLGGIAQSAGLLGFVLAFRYVDSNVGWWVDSHLTIGYFLAILSTVLVVTSTTTAVRSSNGGRPRMVLSRHAALIPSSLR
jgi:hypothetical protein